MKPMLISLALLMAAPAMANPILDDSYPRMSLEQTGYPSIWPKEDSSAKAAGYEPADIVDVEVDGSKNAGRKVAVRGYVLILDDGYAALSNRRDGSNPLLVDFHNASRVLKSNMLNECSDRTITCILQVRGTLVPIAKRPESVFINAD